MSGNCDTITEVLLKHGTDQIQRDDNVLDPGSIKLHGFGLNEWMEFAYNYAKHVHYYDTADHTTPNGNWEDLFVTGDHLLTLLAELDESNTLTPHLTLFICFLKLLELSTERLNGLTKKHLDFYYRKVLQIEKQPEENDQVYVLFELSKNIAQEQLSADTMLNGGKDASGLQRNYQLTEELAANKAKVCDLKNFYFDPDATLENSGFAETRHYMKAASKANTTDGLEEELPEEQLSWYPFGYNHNRLTNSVFTEAADAKTGFALASPVLLLSEGKRHIQITLHFDDNIPALTPQILIDNISVSYTGEKGWVNVNSLSSESTNVSETYATIHQNNVIKLYAFLDSGDEAVVNFDPETHEGTYTAEHPLFRFLINANTEDGLTVYKNLQQPIQTVGIGVQVQGVKNLILENDRGNLNPEKPMYPFTTIPVKGSNFSLYNNEIFSKNWQSISVDIKWKNTPEDFVNWYYAYDKSFEIDLTKSAYFQFFSSPNRTPGQPEAANEVNALAIADDVDAVADNEVNALAAADAVDAQQPVLPNKIVSSNSYFKGTTAIKYNDNWDPKESVVLFTGTHPFQTSFSFTTTDTPNRKGDIEKIRIALDQTFKHELYPRLYAISIADTSPFTTIPNEPYTPFAEEVSMNYSATDEISLTDRTKEGYDNRKITVFHEHPFGQSTEHGYLKDQFDFSLANLCTILPLYCRGGELYIGIENAENLQTVSLLVQVLEGSENPLVASFKNGEKVYWDILCNNEWKNLDPVHLQKNEIDNFLGSGIVAFKIPKEATGNNTLLPDGKFWVRAKMHKMYDTVCQVQGIFAQAVKAKFVNNGNELSHLLTGLPDGTIQKMINRSSKIKSIAQPYNSFGGKPEENDQSYYRRVSERLRHKNRAVTMWDYQHMVLEKFPDIYRVKCLNHTNTNAFVAPGSVTLIVIPDTVNKNVFDLYKPRVSTAYLNDIKNFIDPQNSLHVELEVINPDYEALTVTLEAQFAAGLDETLYKIKLKEDITKLLSPWAFDESKQVEFGATLHQSVLINYIENLDYVDYIQQVTMSVDNGPPIKNYSPSSPKSILVSGTDHIVNSISKPCTEADPIIQEKCQQ